MRTRLCVWPVLAFLVLALTLDSATSNWLQGLLGRFRPGGGRGRSRLDDAVVGAGLRNLGNTCYLNSVLQGLYHVREFRDRVIRSEFSRSSAGWELQRVFRDLSASASSGGRATDPFSLVQKLDINVAIQEDAQEFYLRLLNLIDGDAASPLADGSKVSQLFSGETEQTIKCVAVDYQSSKKQKFLDLSLDATIADDVDGAIQLLFSEKDEIEGYKTPAHGRQNAERTTALVKLPRALCLHLKRFNFDPDLMAITKVGKRISFPFALDLSEIVPALLRSKPATYELASVVVHEGTATTGHYVCFARPDIEKAPQKWIKLDDQSVSQVTEETMRNAAFGGIENLPFSGGASRNAYMLFYVMR